MNSTETLSPAVIRTQEMRYFFNIMSDLAAAKAGNDHAAIAEWVDELEVVAMHFSTPSIVERAAFEAKQAAALLADAAPVAFPGVVLPFARPVLAPLN